MIKAFVNILLVLLFAAPFLWGYMNLFVSSSTISVVNAAIRILTLGVFCLFLLKRDFQFRKPFLIFLLLFFVYYAFALYDVFCGSVPVGRMLGVHKDLAQLRTAFVSLIALVVLCPTIKKYADFVLLAKCLVVINLLTAVLYFGKVDYTLYAVLSLTQDFDDLKILSPFTIANTTGPAILMSLYLKGRWLPNKTLDFCVFVLTLFLNVAILILCNKRGPILYAVVLALFYLFIANKISIKVLLSVSVVSVLILVFGDFILESLFPSLSHLMERFSESANDGASGRIGENSLYSYAWSQILDYPLFGSNMRILHNGTLYGVYPHNFLLEMCMTLGVPIALFFFYLIGKVLYRVPRMFNPNSPYLVIYLYFAYTFLLMMSTGTLFLRTTFWVSLGILVQIISCMEEAEK